MFQQSVDIKLMFVSKPLEAQGILFSSMTPVCGLCVCNAKVRTLESQFRYGVTVNEKKTKSISLCASGLAISFIYLCRWRTAPSNAAAYQSWPSSTPSSSPWVSSPTSVSDLAAPCQYYRAAQVHRSHHCTDHVPNRETRFVNHRLPCCDKSCHEYACECCWQLRRCWTIHAKLRQWPAAISLCGDAAP